MSIFSFGRLGRFRSCFSFSCRHCRIVYCSVFLGLRIFFGHSLTFKLFCVFGCSIHRRSIGATYDARFYRCRFDYCGRTFFFSCSNLFSGAFLRLRQSAFLSSLPIFVVWYCGGFFLRSIILSVGSLCCRRFFSFVSGSLRLILSRFAAAHNNITLLLLVIVTANLFNFIHSKRTRSVFCFNVQILQRLLQFFW